MSDDPLKDAWGEVGAKFGEAFEQLGTALKELGKKLSGVVNDEDLRDQAKQAAASLDGALSKTVDTVGDQVDSLVRKVTKRGPKKVDDDDTAPIDVPADKDSDIIDADVVVEHDEHDQV
jgi:enamine deaminase RidA (YjgF/YER057c/UK114 family)